jgi:predicted lysophospholipase L1 biosynthesis ABC-type transport system permease subunit
VLTLLGIGSGWPWARPAAGARAAHRGARCRCRRSSGHPAPLAEAALYGVLAAALFTLWPLARTGQVRAAALYRDAAGRPAPAARAVSRGHRADLAAALVGLAA